MNLPLWFKCTFLDELSSYWSYVFLGVVHNHSRWTRLPEKFLLLMGHLNDIKLYWLGISTVRISVVSSSCPIKCHGSSISFTKGFVCKHELAAVHCSFVF